VSDEVEEIVEEVRRLSQRFDVVVTSGGIGPTHDDVTLKAVAQALGQSLKPSPEMTRHLREIQSPPSSSSSSSSSKDKEAKEEEMLRLSLLPEFSRLHFPPAPDDYSVFSNAKGESVRVKTWPILQCDNIFVLPGIPKFFAAKMELIVKYFLTKYSPLETRKIILDVEERNIVRFLDALVERNTEVKVGAYPFVDHPDFKTIITIQGVSQEKVDVAVAELLEMIPSHYVLRVENGLHPQTGSHQ
jgi:FAD synthetase